MKHSFRLAAALAGLVVLASWPASSQEFQPSGDPDLDARLRSLIQGSFLNVACKVPSIQPSVCVLKRSSSPNRKFIIDTFAGGEANIIGQQTVNSPIWGSGTRMKAGTVVYANDGEGPHAPGQQKVELSPAQIDFFSSGFTYQNNIPHKPVYATQVKYNEARPAEVSYFKVYAEAEGRKAAKALLSSMLGELTLPAGFQLSESDSILTEGERLYVYRAQPEFITTFPVFTTDASGKTVQSGAQPVAVPLMDAYVQVALDGDMLLCALEYYWDSNLTAEGTLQESIHAGEAVLKSREWLMQLYQNSPPLMSVAAIRLGFIQNRKDRSRLIPVWLFDAGAERRVREELAGGAGATESIMRLRDPFAVHAITGECIDL